MDCSYLPAGVIKSNRGHGEPQHKFKQSALAGADTEGARLGGRVTSQQDPFSPDLHPGDILLDHQLALFIHSSLY